MSIALYHLFLFVYSATIRLASLWNPKARKWVNGRRNWRSSLGSRHLAGCLSNDENLTIKNKVVWMHCASLGEFEQGRPLLDAVRAQYPGHKIVLTFFSPSGYENRKNYTGADLIMYLPMDGPDNARDFINAINPSIVLWIKYEYWFYYLLELKKRQIPVLLISGIFRKSQPFFRWYGGLWKRILGSFDHFFVQTAYSEKLLKTTGNYQNISITGDTRFDRVTAIADEWTALDEQINNFCGNHLVLVAGSTWEEDEVDLIHYAKTHPEMRFIIAPHEINKQRMADLLTAFPEAWLYSALIKNEITTTNHSNVLIIDNIGMLSRLYKYATVTYVGGGFNQSGIHNILEAAVYGKPVVIGPVYKKFAEARDLVNFGAAFSIENALELEAVLDKLFNEPSTVEKCGAIARNYVYGHRGATNSIMDYIQKNRLLTS